MIHGALTVDLLQAFLTSVPQARTLSALLELTEAFERPLAPVEEPIYDEVLLGLARSAFVEVRTHLSQRLAGLDTGAIRTVSNLALDLDVTVASPVLKRSLLVSERDLITVSRTRSQDHLAAVAERSNLRDGVTDGLIARGGWPVLRLLAANRLARLSSQGLERLIRLSRGDGHITASLMEREDVPSVARTWLIRQFRHLSLSRRPTLRGEDSGVSLEAMPLLSNAVTFERSTEMLTLYSDDDLAIAGARIDALACTRPLNSAAVARMAAHGDWADALVAIGRLAGESPKMLQDHLAIEVRIGNVALLIMRAADLEWMVVEHLMRAFIDRAHPGAGLAARGIARHHQAYLRLTGEQAKRLLHHLRPREELSLIHAASISTTIANL